MSSQSASLMSVYDLAKEAWSRYTNGLKTYTILALILVVPSFVMSLLLGPKPTGAGGLVSAIITILFGSVAAISLAYAMQDGAARHSREYFEASRDVLARYVGVQLGRGILELIGFFLFIIPGIIVMTWFVFADFAVIFERIGPAEAFRWSRDHVKGRFFPTLLRIIAVVVLGVPFFVLGFVIDIFLPGAVGSAIAQHVMILFFAPFVVSYMYSFYMDFKRTRELAVEGA